MTTGRINQVAAAEMHTLLSATGRNDTAARV